jgi:hypothetical protein
MMGMFDTISLPLKCPNCGDEGEKELQTKDLMCLLSEYRKGDYVGTKRFRWLDCLAGCTSKTCLAWEQKKYKGMSNGFGYCWDVEAEVDEHGRITGVVKSSTDAAAFPDHSKAP